MTSLSRRHFLRLLAGTSTFPLISSCKHSSEGVRQFDIPGQIVNPHIPGHLVRARHTLDNLPPPKKPIYDVIIVGGGVSGLSAAWKLQKAGVENLLVLEQAEELGGTAIAGSVNGTAFPWGAHYINIPPAEADCIQEVLEDLGVITGYDNRGQPRIAPQHLLQSPKERLFINKEWVEELDPFSGANRAEIQILQAFEDDMLRWTVYKGPDGRRAFAIPLHYSSQSPDIRQLDNITMEAYLRSRQWHCRKLDWLVNYACRDDYGGTIDTVSAWAGIHYFACRFYDERFQDRYPSDTLTWSQGNAFLVDGLASRLRPEQYQTQSLVLRLEQNSNDVDLVCLNVASGTYQCLKGKAVVFAAKQHMAPHIILDLPAPQRHAMAACTYSPWLVAAIHVKHIPDDPLVPVAWDNVLYHSPSSGYIVANHQERGIGNNTPSVLVYYRPFVHDVDAARRNLHKHDHRYWVNQIMTDLTQAHPNLEAVVERIDIYRWGHAMIRPVPGTIWGQASQWRQKPFGAIFFASCDATGLPLFEEACFAGIRAAELAMNHLIVSFQSSLRGLDTQA